MAFPVMPFHEHGDIPQHGGKNETLYAHLCDASFSCYGMYTCTNSNSITHTYSSADVYTNSNCNAY